MPDSRVDRRHAARLTLALLAIVLMTAAAIVAAHWPFIERAIALEDAPIAWLQSTLLAACAVVCLHHTVLQPTRRRPWCLIAAALFVLALDERFMGHERLKEWIWLELFDGDTARAGRWPDLPILAYGLGGAAVVTWTVREVRDAYAGRLLWAALGFGVVALAIDVISQSIALQIVEELAELTAECLFFTGLLLMPVTATPER